MAGRSIGVVTVALCSRIAQRPVGVLDPSQVRRVLSDPHAAVPTCHLNTEHCQRDGSDGGDLLTSQHIEQRVGIENCGHGHCFQ